MEKKKRTNKKKPLSEYTVADLILTAEFQKNAENIINGLKAERRDYREKAYMAGREMKRHPIDYLDLSAGNFIVEYTAVLSKNSSLSSVCRSFIKAIGDEAAQRTIKQLQDEK